ncbi:MAG: PA0069 family radical SAM protein [Caulobacterales bacterium]|nr:PA0069 family radical SAM protein [Caulobacterales bacterium]
MNTASKSPQPGGRGARSNRASRFEPVGREAFDDGWSEPERGAAALRTELAPFAARRAITYNASPDLSFDRTINPYKGCEHGCVYCYARPAHAYLGLSPGLDFESRIFWKKDAARLLERELAAPRYRPAMLVIGGDTDPYQPAERESRVTRSILEVLAACRHPCAIVTKSPLILRDLDLLAPMAADGLFGAAVSVTTLDRSLARAMEPRAATPARRLEAIAGLAEAGVPVRVMTAPMIPGLNDAELEAILAAARDAGATQAGYVLLRLPREIADLFQEWLADTRPAAAGKVMSLLRGARGGAAYTHQWFERGRGRGPYADLLAQRFAAAARRLGLSLGGEPLRVDLFRPPRADGQGDLFTETATAGP